MLILFTCISTIYTIKTEQTEAKIHTFIQFNVYLQIDADTMPFYHGESANFLYLMTYITCNLNFADSEIKSMSKSLDFVYLHHYASL